MIILGIFCGNSDDVRAIVPEHLQNQVPGFATWISSKRITAPCGFFMRSVRAHQSMVGRMGELKGSPGSFDDRYCKPCSVRHPMRFATQVVNSSNIEGVQP